MKRAHRRIKQCYRDVINKNYQYKKVGDKYHFRSDKCIEYNKWQPVMNPIWYVYRILSGDVDYE